MNVRDMLTGVGRVAKNMFNSTAVVVGRVEKSVEEEMVSVDIIKNVE